MLPTGTLPGLSVSDLRAATMKPRLLPALLFAALLSGCATTSGSLSALRGRTLLVVDTTGDELQQARLNRAITLLPVRAWPAEADARLKDTLAEATKKLAESVEAAEKRRIPWLLVHDADGVRVITARGGRILWEATLRGRAPTEEQVRDQLLKALITRGSATGPLDPRDTRLAPPDAIVALRGLAAEGRWEEHEAVLKKTLLEYPADPALRTHEGLARSLTAGHAESLEQARAMNPEGESELFAIALSADAALNRALGLAARELLVSLYPERLDYLPELADLVAEAEGNDAALTLLSAGRQTGRTDALERVPSTAFPHDLPDALPWADLAFSHGWYLAQLERWEQAALSYEEAAGLYERLGRRVELGDTLNNAGVAMVEADRPLIAARTFGRAILVRSGGDPVKAANSQYNQGRAYSDANKTAQALRAWRTAARDYSVAGRPWDALETRIESLGLMVKEGDSEGMEAEAADILDGAARSEGPKVRILEAEGNTWFELGRGRLTFRDPDGSLEAYRRSLTVWQKLGRPVEEGQTLYSMALPHLAKFEFEAAFEDLVAALEIAGAQGDSVSIIAIREQLGEIQDLVRKSGRPVPKVPKALQEWIH
jgi:tetratricopeptide (TPR) repeat protein